MRGLKMAGAMIALACAAGTAQAATLLSYSGVLVFGDSLVDAGNAQRASLSASRPDPTPAAGGYYQGRANNLQGRFSNGPNFADYLSIAITGGETASSLAGGGNHAFGGALAAPAPAGASPSFTQQVAGFTARNQPIAADTLVIVTFGGNDVRETALAGGGVSFDASANALRSGLDTLIGAGARNILVTGLPDIGQLPAVAPLAFLDPARPGELSARSATLSDAFRQVTYATSRRTGADVDFFDLLRFQKTVQANPGAYGLGATLNTTTPCQRAGAAAVLGGCVGYLYFDDIHPTTAVHEVIAGGIATRLAAVPEPQTWAMLIAGTGMIGGMLRRRRARATATA
ncbi:MAG: SGNH/GDSL hydrolase family protein [Sphingomonas sp.]